MGVTQTKKPLTDILTSEDFILRAEPLAAGTYAQGDLLTYDGAVFSKASLASGTDHTESFAVVYEGATVVGGEKIAIILEGAVDGNLLSADYQALSADDKKAVNKELMAKNIIVEVRS